MYRYPNYLDPTQFNYWNSQDVKANKMILLPFPTVFKNSCTVIRIRIRKDPHHLAGSGILDADTDPADPDSRLQNWHLINLFSVEKYCE
jgi:hypothetical protein